MKSRNRSRLLTLGTATALLVGILLVVFTDYLLTVVGIVLIILSAIVFMYVVKVRLLDAYEHSRA